MIFKKIEITNENIKEFLYYDPESGNIISKIKSGPNVMPGKQLGSIDKKTRYLRIQMFGYQYYAHRLAWLYMTNEWPKGQIDHINNNGSDNRWCNLRVVTSQQNKLNRPKQSNNKSGWKGVHWHKAMKKWEVEIKSNGERIILGYFVDSKEAALVYNKAAMKYHGEYAHLNKVF